MYLKRYKKNGWTFAKRVRCCAPFQRRVKNVAVMSILKPKLKLSNAPSVNGVKSNKESMFFRGYKILTLNAETVKFQRFFLCPK